MTGLQFISIVLWYEYFVVITENRFNPADCVVQVASTCSAMALYKKLAFAHAMQA
jgi:hypothetical protein